MGKRKINYPAKIKINSKVDYELLFSTNLDEGESDGHCRYPERQIILRNNLNESNKKTTLIHELLHAFSFESKKLTLTEKQVLELEKMLYTCLRVNKDFWIEFLRSL